MKQQIETLLDYATAWKIVYREKLFKLARSRIAIEDRRGRLSLRMGLHNGVVTVLDYWRRKNGFALRVRHSGRIDRLVLIPAETEEEREILLARLRFREALQQLLEAHGWKVLVGTHRSDPVRHFSGNYLRMLVDAGGAEAAVLAVSPAEAALAAGHMFGTGLLWFRHLRQRASVGALWLLVPAGCAAALAPRLGWIRAPVRLFEFDLAARRLELFQSPDLAADLYCWPERHAHSDALLARVEALAPGLVRRCPRPGGYDSLRVRGLEFGRYFWNEKKLVYGVTTATVLRRRGWSRLRALVEEICRVRAWPGDPDHPYYRHYQERWLESLVLENVAALDDQLDNRFAYSQVPTYVGGDQAWIDVLTCTRRGRLAIIELKCRSDLDLPLQGLHYWSRVWRHLLEGSFERRGYFRGVRLRRQPPLLYLVTPLFQIHPGTRLLLPFVSGEIEIVVVGINADWKKGIRVLRRTRM